jgi:hypothetical protein
VSYDQFNLYLKSGWESHFLPWNQS